MQEEYILTTFAQVLVLHGFSAVHPWAELWDDDNNQIT